MPDIGTLLGLDDIPDTPFKPYKINQSLTRDFFLNIRESVKVHARILFKESGWRFYITDQVRGRCYYSSKVITVPAWVYKREANYKEYYISHEMAHAFAGWQANHGPKFMAELIRICPEDALHHELGYKPRNAMAAGIGAPKWITLLDL